MSKDLKPAAYEGVNTDMLTHAKWGHPKSRVDVPDEVVGEWEPLVRVSDLPHLVEFIIQRLMAGNALDENGADKLRREVDEQFQIYGDSGLNSGDADE